MSTQQPPKRVLREQRRAAREQAEQAAAERAVRRRRLRWLALIAGLAALVVGVAVLVSAGGESDAPTSAATPADAALFAGLSEREGVLGDPKAPLTVTEFVDLQCPVCAVAARETLPQLVRDYVRTGKVRLQLRVLHFIGPDSERAARVAAGALRQGRLFRFVDAFYANQGEENSGYVTDAFLRRVAVAAGVDADAALAQAGAGFAQRQLSRANADATRLGVDATPTLAVARRGRAARRLAASPLDPAAVRGELDAELAR